MINNYKQLLISLFILTVMFNMVNANSRVAFSRPGNMMRIPSYAFNHENPYFFSIGISSEIINFSDGISNYGKSSNSASIKMQTNTGFTFGLTAGNIIDTSNVGEIGFHIQAWRCLLVCWNPRRSL